LAPANTPDEALTEFRGKNAAVLTIPGGGVVVSYEIATVLVVPLAVIVLANSAHSATLN